MSPIPMDNEPDRPSGELLAKLRRMEARFEKKGVTDAVPMPEDAGPSMVRTKNGMPLDIEPIAPTVVPAVVDPNAKPIRLEREAQLPTSMEDVVRVHEQMLANDALPGPLLVKFKVQLYAGDVLVAETEDVGLWLQLMQRFGGAR